MDLPPPVQDPERPDQSDEQSRRLAAVEAELIGLGARIEQLEASLQQAVRDETRRASNEIRHTVSELGRRLALDLPQFLDRHRQLIVGELRAGGAAAGLPAPAPADPAGDAPAAAGAEAGAPTGGTAGAGSDADGGASSDESASGRRKQRRRRKEG
jgi:hypothetical protein